MSRILYQEEYLDALQQKNLTQQDSACDQIVKNLSMSTQIEVRNNAESSNNITMTDKSVRCVSVSKEKKLVKEFKN